LRLSSHQYLNFREETTMTGKPFNFDRTIRRYLVTAPLTERDIIDQAKRILAARISRSHPLSNPSLVRDYLATEFSGLGHEVFAVLFLDNRHRLIAFRPMFHGTINGCAVYPREIARAALRYNAAAVIFTHNHPSGVAEPSRADELLTTRLKEALSILDVQVLDHLVVGGTTVVSIAERGLL
jgi:DNA repair protein RadC